MSRGRGAVCLSLLLVAGAAACREKAPPFRRPEVAAARSMGGLLRDARGDPYFQAPGCTLRFGAKGRSARLAADLSGPCRLEVRFWSPARGRLRLRAQGTPAEKEFPLRPGLNDLTAEARLSRGERLLLEADRGGIFSRPLLYRVLPAAERRNVFLISVDSLGADHLPAYGYGRDTAPAVSAFRGEAVLFGWAFAGSPWTLPSHMSLFTSLPETRHCVGQRVLNEEEAAAGRAVPEVRAFPLRRGTESLVERLCRAFVACGFTGGVNVAALYGFHRGFDLYEEARGDLLDRRAAARLFARVQGQLLRHPYPAAFYFLHTYQVHLPYRPPDDLLGGTGLPPSLRTFDFNRDIGGIRGIFRGGGGRRPADAAALYDAGVREFDRRFGEFIAFLKASGLYDRAMIILLSDHGEEFLEHGSWAHGTDLFNSQVRVPLLVKFPGGLYAGRRFDGPVGLVDVMPTVLDFYGIAAPPGIGGRSLLAGLRGAAPPRPVFSANLECRSWARIPAQAAWIEDGFKLIRHFPPPADTGRFFDAPPPAFPPFQLYRLLDDPREERDLAAGLPQVVRYLGARLRGFLAGGGESVPGQVRVLPRDSLDALRTLGYIR
jgi:choline-sulfatase